MGGPVEVASASALVAGALLAGFLLVSRQAYRAEVRRRRRLGMAGRRREGITRRRSQLDSPE